MEELPKEPSFAMQMIKEDIRRERHKDTILGIIISIILICWTFSIYMIFSYFTNAVVVGSGDTNQSVEDISGNNNNIDQRG